MARQGCFLPTNVALAGGTFTCNWGGRDGEWKIISESHAREQLSKGLDYFVCPHHKTAKEFGEAVKNICQGSQECFRHYMELPPHASKAPGGAPAQGADAPAGGLKGRGKRKEPPAKGTRKGKGGGKGESEPLLFRPIHGHTVYFSGLLKVYGRRFLPGSKHPTINLMRKRMHKHVLALHKDHPALAALGKVDKHSINTILKHYVAMEFAEQSLLGKQTIRPSHPRCCEAIGE